MAKYKIKRILTRIFKPVFGVIVVLVTVFPIYWLVAMAIRPTDEMKGHISLIPHTLTLEHFMQLFQEKGFGTALVNSLEVTLISLIVSLVFGLCAAYVLTRQRFKFGLKKPLNTWVLIVRILPPIAFTIPLYTMFNRLGVLSSKLPVIMACILINIPFIIWFMVSFFQNLPEDMERSARVDGANEWQLFTRIVLPLVLPGIAAVAMLSFMYAWNEYTYSIIFVQSPANYTIPLKLATLNSDDALTNFGLVAAGGVVSAVPILLFIIFAQNYLIAGLSSGAVKE
jgi:ABC-type glycerol-3-phosphate transport system permease component